MRVPDPWSGRLPWDDPAFSERMLREHMNPEHDAASRRPATVSAHVDWIHRDVLGGVRSRVLDLCCGPGLYTARLAARGHSCVGIDFAPAAVRHARAEARRAGAGIDYRLEDAVTADYGEGFDLVMLLFGDLDTFPPGDAARVVSKAAAALDPGGRLLLEVHTPAAVERAGTADAVRSRAARGLFSDDPYEIEEAARWYPATGASVWAAEIRHHDGRVERVSVTTQSRAEDVYPGMLSAAGFTGLRRLPGFGGTADPDFTTLVAVRP